MPEQIVEEIIFPSKTSFHLNRLKIILSDHIQQMESDETNNPLHGLFIAVTKCMPIEDLENGQKLLNYKFQQYAERTELKQINVEELIKITDIFFEENAELILKQEELNSSKINKIKIGIIGTFIPYLITHQCLECCSCCSQEELIFCLHMIAYEFQNIITDKEDIKNIEKILAENTFDELHQLIFNSN